MDPVQESAPHAGSSLLECPAQGPGFQHRSLWAKRKSTSVRTNVHRGHTASGAQPPACVSALAGFLARLPPTALAVFSTFCLQET